MESLLQGLMDTPVRIAVCNQISDIWVYFLAAAVMEAMAVYSWRYRKIPAARYLTGVLIARAVWLVALVMISLSPSLEGKIAWSVILQSSAIALLPLFMLIALHITEQPLSLIRKVRRPLYALTFFFWLAMLTNDWHGWWLRGMTIDGEMLVFLRGPLQLALILSTYGATLAGFALCIIWAFRVSGLRRWRALAVPAGALLAIIGYVAWGKNPQGGTLPYLPLGFMLGSIVWIGIFYGLRIFNLQELAERAVMQNMNDSLLVIDKQGCVVEMNPAAQSLFATRLETGHNFFEAVARWPDFAEALKPGQPLNGELCLAGLGNCHYRFNISPLSGWCGSKLGLAVVLSDVSVEKEAQAKVLEQQKALAIMTERRRLGRELHDGDGQVWGYLLLQFKALQKLLTTGCRKDVEAQLEKLIALAGDVHANLRESIVGLKSAPEEKGFVATLRDFVCWYEKSFAIRTSLKVATDAPSGFSPLVNLQLLRIIQETMTNTRKYANAGEVKLEFFVEGAEAVVVVSDDGDGFSAADEANGLQDHYGLEIMRERTAEIGGHLKVESAPGSGTKVTVRLPYSSGSDFK